MNLEDDKNQAVPPQPPYPPPQPQTIYIQSQPAKKGILRRILGFLFMVPVVVVNLLLVFGLIGFFAFFFAGREGIYTEEVIEQGPITTKIAVVNLKELIDDENAKLINKQLKLASEDDYVKGVIVRVNSPGGMVSSSDRIYNEILKYKDRTQKPVVAFMEGIAASGGYYSAVACDKIVAEPTVITGSIGVLFGHLIVQQLMEEKLGIKPVIIKSGEKKDWPSPFADMTPEQITYIEQKLINPAYERFVGIVADQRTELSLDDVKRLADGSIYTAAEALDEKLIDDIGYLDKAIETVKKMAGIDKAKVFEYKRPFPFRDFFRSQHSSLWKMDKSAIYELTSPQLLYLWTIY
jgi:protease-4